MTAKKLEPVISLHRYTKIANVLVVGCGGTGGHLVPHLARFISVINESREKQYSTMPVVRLFLADGDIVEKKNLIRQNFIEPDIGRNKAEVLGERYAAAFGLEIGVVPEYLERLNKFSFLTRSIGYGDQANVIIGCVDNNASRKVIHRWFCRKDTNSYGEGRFWIDSGNEEASGQVVCGYNPPDNRYNQPRFNPFRKDIDKVTHSRRCGEFCLPCAVEVYPELLRVDDKFSSKQSCAERSRSAPQNMQTNVTAAVIIMNFVQKLLSRSALRSYSVEFAINNTFCTRLNTPKNLKCVSKGRGKIWEKRG